MKPDALDVTFQSAFHRRWGHLSDPHVRALTWLLDAPDLLDPDAPRWHGKIASLAGSIGSDTAEWLAAQDRDPARLHAYLALHPFARLGRYAEKLMAFYFEHTGQLHAHGVQVRADKNDTVGEFDFLLRRGSDLVHWEFATKFYLMESSGASHASDYFVGPNLADTLGAKMRKILDRQLILAQHPAAQSHLPQPVVSAQALVKGWLFYSDGDPAPGRSMGIMEGHCHGFWCTQQNFSAIEGEMFAVLPRLSWLAPARLAASACVNRAALQQILQQHFVGDTMPVMIAVMQSTGPDALEKNRGFIVPDDWCERAASRPRQTG
ncbi:MAG: DUF1853 family protein [Herminiimonas sp.]|nr:DUF1853 family protein [Herminiimonas sp.]